MSNIPPSPPSNVEPMIIEDNLDDARGKKRAAGKAPGPEWQFAKNLRRFVDWECNFCHVRKSGGASRIKDHLLGGNTKSIAKCTGRDAEEAARKLRALISAKGAKKTPYFASANCTQQSTKGSNDEELLRDSWSLDDDFNFEVGTSSKRMSRDSTNRLFGDGSTPVIGTKQISIEESVRVTKLQGAQHSLAQAMYFSGSALSMVESHEWKHAWKVIGEYGPGFIPPTYKNIRTQLLDECYEEVKMEMDRVIMSQLTRTGCTIVSDGWSNVQRRPLINIMLVCPKGECFVKAIDTSGEIKTGSYIATLLGEVIDQVGPSNVVQVVMDNAKNCRAAGNVLQDRYPHLYTSGCNTHSLNLVLLDWYRSDDTDWFRTIVDACRKIVKFVMKRQRVLDVFRQRMVCMLKLPAETRFCTNYYMIESLLMNKNEIQETWNCRSFCDWKDSQSSIVTAKAESLEQKLSDSKFWEEVADVYHVMMPVMLGLRTLDSRAPNIGKVWMTWLGIQRSLQFPEELKDTIAKTWRPPFSKTKRKILDKYVQSRWKAAHSPLHSVAFLLDPEYWNIPLEDVDKEIMPDFYDFVSSFYPDKESQTAAIRELATYKLKEGMFASGIVQECAQNEAAWRWWMLNGQSASTLRTIAIRVLAQCASNSSSERNWSTYKYVHSTVRNRLLSDRAEKLVYMYCNNKVLSRLKNKDYEEYAPQWTYEFLESDHEDDARSNNSMLQCDAHDLHPDLEVDHGVDRADKRKR